MSIFSINRENVKNVLESYDLHLSVLQHFLKEFSVDDSKGPHADKKYLNRLQAITDKTSISLEISIDDLIQYVEEESSIKTEGLIWGILNNSKRYLLLLYRAAELVKCECTTVQDYATKILSMSLERSMEQAKVPVEFRVNYELHLNPSATQGSLSVREVRASHVGQLIRIDALVTRVSSIKPRIQIATYKCHDCGAEIFQSVDATAYMPVSECSSQTCSKNTLKGELQLIMRESKFVKYQDIIVQEESHHVPHGTIPRSMKIVVEGELTRKLSPGMSVTLGGIVLPVTKTGYAALRAGLLTDTFFEVHSIDVHKKGYKELANLDEQLKREVIKKFKSEKNLYEKLANSIAPAICGLEDVKKGLLLQLVGGASETFSDGMQIRGDIHILLMGDPGVAKSQLLREICKVAPRAHYSTGKGASGVGLTASVIKDANTGEFALEGGAIVLSDNGVCCIDEFDKMDESDRTAIHEVMEQQTVSIAKAGLTATLNARTSILAAANPVFGRYDTSKGPVANMNLPYALLSRFDLQFLLLDKPDLQKDTDLAKHVLYVHRHSRAPDKFNDVELKHFSAAEIRAFIAVARQYKPKLTPQLVKSVIEHYVEMRNQSWMNKSSNLDNETYTTPRTLLAILRMAQALARLRLSNTILHCDTEEAIRLMRMSKASIVQSEEKKQLRRFARDFRSEIMEIIKDMDIYYSRTQKGWNGWIGVNDAIEKITQKNFSRSQLEQTLLEYSDLEIIIWNEMHSVTNKEFAFAERIESTTGGLA